MYERPLYEIYEKLILNLSDLDISVYSENDLVY